MWIDELNKIKIEYCRGLYFVIEIEGKFRSEPKRYNSRGTVFFSISENASES